MTAPIKERESKEEKRERAQRLEAFLGKDLICPEGWRLWCQQDLRWTESQSGKVWVIFCDYWKAQPGQKGIKADWEATWRNWCRRESSFQKQTPPAKGEVRVRETTAAEQREGLFTQEVIRLRRLPENYRKSDDEIAALADAAIGSMA